MTAGELWRRILFLSRRTKASEELDEEMRLHLELREQLLRERGLDPESARDEARRCFGNLTQIAETGREEWKIERFLDVMRDFRFAARSLRRRPGFAAVAILSLATALGANTAVFSFVRAIVMRQLPVPGADRLVIVQQHNEQFHMDNCCFKFGFYEELRKQDLGLEDLVAVKPVEVKFTDREETEKLAAEIVSGNYFRFFNVQAAAGRLDEIGDDVRSAGSCVISYRIWQERFSGDPGIIGRRVLVNGAPLQVAGVFGRGFTGTSLYRRADVLLPTAATSTVLGFDRDVVGWTELMGRMRPHVTRAQVLARMNEVGLGLQRADGTPLDPRDTFLLLDGSQGLDSKKDRFAKPVLLLLGLVGVVLVIACANLAALLIVRNVERTAEAGVRLALGGSRMALVRQLFTESLVIAGIGGAAGLGIAAVLAAVLLKLLGTDGTELERYVRPDWQVFLFNSAAALAACLLFGLLPAWRAAQCDPLPAIRGVSSAGRRRALVSRGLLVVQLALSTALLFSAGLFVRTLSNLRSIDLGFNPENVALLHIDAEGTARGKAPAPFYRELLRRTRELPGTRAAGLTDMSIISGSMQSIILRIPGFVPSSGFDPTTYFTRIGDGYFRTLGIPLLRGRDFTTTDRENSVIVNATFARRFLGGDGVGKAFSYGGGHKVVVVGVVGSSHFRWLKEDPQPVMYVPITDGVFPAALYLQVRTEGDGSAAIERLRALVRRFDPRVLIDSVTTMELQIDAAVTRERLLAFLSALMGGVAVLLASIGLYGAMSFSVVRRTREIGIRLAVGAERRCIFTQILKESASVLVAGAALGVPLALGAGALAANLLYGLKPRDPLTIAVAVAVPAVVALIAAAIPAWRAARLDAIRALRWE